MSIGLRFIRAVVQQGAVPALLGIRPDYLLEVDEEAEAGAYQFARQHVSAHGVLPDVEMFDEAGFPLGRATTQPVSYYVERLRQRHLYKRINDRFSDLSTAMHARQMDTVLDVLRQMLASTVSHSNNSVSTLASLATDVRNDYLLAKEFPGLRGITTGWGILDAVTLGWQPTDVVVIAGRTGMGKSWVLAKMAYEAWIAGATPLVVTMEMGQLQFARRFVGIHSGINPGFIRAGELSHFGEAQLDAKVQQLVDGASNFHLMAGDFSKKVTAVEAMIEELNPTVAFIDAAYLLSTEGAKKGYITKWESIANVMAELKTVAIRKGIPIVLTVQMNRNKKKDNNTVADTTDLAGSDSISQDASAVITLRRGLAPYENVRRVLDLIKFREGEEISFSTNFRFNPVDFSEVEDSTDEAPVGDGSTTSWMI